MSMGRPSQIRRIFHISPKKRGIGSYGTLDTRSKSIRPKIENIASSGNELRKLFAVPLTAKDLARLNLKNSEQHLAQQRTAHTKPLRKYFARPLPETTSMRLIYGAGGTNGTNPESKTYFRDRRKTDLGRSARKDKSPRKERGYGLRINLLKKKR